MARPLQLLVRAPEGPEQGVGTEALGVGTRDDRAEAEGGRKLSEQQGWSPPACGCATPLTARGRRSQPGGSENEREQNSGRKHVCL